MPRVWITTDELSLEKELQKRVMIYYAAPHPYKYGFFSSTIKARRNEFLAQISGTDRYGKQ